MNCVFAENLSLQEKFSIVTAETEPIKAIRSAIGKAIDREAKKPMPALKTESWLHDLKWAALSANIVPAKQDGMFTDGNNTFFVVSRELPKEVGAG